MKKTCTNCGSEKLLTDFYRRSGALDGRCSECKECTKRRNVLVHKNHYKKNREKLLIEHRKYGKKYRKRKDYRIRRNERNRERMKTDIFFKLSHSLRRRMHSAIKREQKSGSAVRDLGCSIEYFKVYIEGKFQPKMSWDNYGEWHLDHIKPLASFKLSDRKRFLDAAHYTNYQPLWAKDNLRKGTSI